VRVDATLVAGALGLGAVLLGPFDKAAEVLAERGRMVGGADDVSFDCPGGHVTGPPSPTRQDQSRRNIVEGTLGVGGFQDARPLQHLASPSRYAVTAERWVISRGRRLAGILAGANEFDAADIAKVIERRPWPSYEERMAVFSPAGSAGASRKLPSSSSHLPLQMI
jgi:hypothetical protein